MEPYTVDGVARREQSNFQNDTCSESGSVTDLSKSVSSQSLNSVQSCNSNTTVPPDITYELVGVIVHSGQANAGHYYSFIKDRRFVIQYDNSSFPKLYLTLILICGSF